VAHPSLKWAALVLFFGYAATLVLAGAVGAVAAPFDLSLTAGLEDPEASLLAQHRFLRAVEFGFGAFALLYWRQIFRRRAFNRGFLAVMTAGVAARLLSLVVDGVPSAAMVSFLAWELVGVAAIFAYTSGTLED
jgi:peptidoglycan/LPS O-acetylase OafA/YrhL